MSDSPRVTWSPLIGAAIALVAYSAWCVAYVRSVVEQLPPGCAVQVRGSLWSVRACGPYESAPIRRIKVFRCKWGASATNGD